MVEAEIGVPITKTIRELNVGDEACFPIERNGSVKAVVSRLRLELVRVGWNARVTRDMDNYQVKVRRIK